RLDDAPEIDEVGARGADLGEHGLLIGLLPVDALVGDDGQADLFGGGLEDVRDAFAAELLVMEDVDFLDVHAIGPLGVDGALDVVSGNGPEVVREAARTIDVRLPGRRAPLLRQAGVRVGGRDLRHVSPVGDRDRDLGGAGVVRADVDDGERIGDRLVRVLRLDGAGPLAGLRRRVVQSHDFQAIAGDDTLYPGHGEIDAVLHAGAFRQHRALHGPRRVQTQLALRTLLGVHVSAGGDDAEDDRGDRDDPCNSHG